jgi:hypothetical protein
MRRATAMSKKANEKRRNNGKAKAARRTHPLKKATTKNTLRKRN